MFVVDCVFCKDLSFLYPMRCGRAGVCARCGTTNKRVVRSLACVCLRMLHTSKPCGGRGSLSVRFPVEHTPMPVLVMANKKKNLIG